MPTTTTTGYIGCKLLDAAPPVEWDWQNRVVRFTRKYHIVGMSPEAAVSLYYGSATTPDTIPNTISIETPSSLGVCVCQEVSRSIENVPGKATQAVLVLGYEGADCMGEQTNATWWNGIVASTFDHGTKTEQIVLEYGKDANGNRRSIGANAEGTQRIVPGVMWRIIQNVTESDWQDRTWIYANLAGRVNHDQWTDPVFGLQWIVGSWLYHGPKASEPRAGYVQLTHTFEYSPDLHYYNWFRTEEKVEALTNGAGEPTRRRYSIPIPPEVNAQIYLRTGQDEDNATDYTVPTFDDIFCASTSVTTDPTVTTTAGA